MNNYDYFNYLNGFGDMNYMTSPNGMIGDLNYSDFIPNMNNMPSINNVPSNNMNNMPNMNTNNGKTKDLFNSEEGFKRGNMFASLYDQYKDYKPITLKAGSEREDMLMQIQEAGFAMIDLGLYLDTNPNDKEMLKLFNMYRKKEKELCNMFEKKYGPLTFDSEVNESSWLWNKGPWPWEVQR